MFSYHDIACMYIYKSSHKLWRESNIISGKEGDVKTGPDSRPSRAAIQAASRSTAGHAAGHPLRQDVWIYIAISRKPWTDLVVACTRKSAI